MFCSIFVLSILAWLLLQIGVNFLLPMTNINSSYDEYISQNSRSVLVFITPPPHPPTHFAHSVRKLVLDVNWKFLCQGCKMLGCDRPRTLAGARLRFLNPSPLPNPEWSLRGASLRVLYSMSISVIQAGKYGRRVGRKTIARSFYFQLGTR